MKISRTEILLFAVLLAIAGGLLLRRHAGAEGCDAWIETWSDGWLVTQ